MISENGGAYLTFGAGGRRFALPVGEVVRVAFATPGEMFPVPFGLGGRVEAIASLRGELVAVSRVPGVERFEAGETIKLVIAGGALGSFGIIVDWIGEIGPLADSELLSADRLFEGKI